MVKRATPLDAMWFDKMTSSLKRKASGCDASAQAWVYIMMIYLQTRKLA
jgi:hypothetical protein